MRARWPPATVLPAALLAIGGPARADAPPASGEPAGAEARPAPVAAPKPPPLAVVKPPPLHVEYAQYGVAFSTTVMMASGPTCGSSVKPPCILGSGGGLVVRGGYRAPGPWYIGGAYEFTKMDSGNLYRLGIFQQVRAEMRYLPDLGQRVAPYATWGLGGVAYGNEWGIETGGANVFAGGGVEMEVSRLAVVGLGLVYRPTLIVGWQDSAGIERPLGLAHFFGIELQLEVRTELGRR